MSKRTSQVVRAGQLQGTKLKFEAVENDGLRECVTIINQGTVAQPMSGWVLASLRGHAFYSFPDDLMFEPGMIVEVQSGQMESQKANNARPVWKKLLQSIRTNLLWTIDQVWNNHSDVAILFDVNGIEVDRLSYPHGRVMGSSANRRKVLIHNNDGFEIVNDMLRHAKKITRKQSGAFTKP